MAPNPTVTQNLPPPQAPFVLPATGILSYNGYQYLLALIQAIEQAQPTATLATGLVATGATQATALQIDKEWNIFSTVPSGSGALLELLQPGQTQAVYNADTNPLSVYPPAGMQIDALGNNTAYSLVGSKWQFFRFIMPTQIYSMQLG